jgi:hypothetical protein
MADEPTMKRALDWERPDPARLNDTAALVRKGTYNYQLETRAGCKSDCEYPWNAENTFNKRMLPAAGVCGPYGAGSVIAVRTPKGGNGGGGADRNTRVPGNGNSLAGGIGEVRRSGRDHP